MTKRERIEWRLGMTILYRQLMKDTDKKSRGVITELLEKHKGRIVEINEDRGFTIYYKEHKYKKGEKHETTAKNI